MCCLQAADPVGWPMSIEHGPMWPKLQSRNPNPSTPDLSSQSSIFFVPERMSCFGNLHCFKGYSTGLGSSTQPFPVRNELPNTLTHHVRAWVNKVSTTGTWGLTAFLFDLGSRAAGAGAGIRPQLALRWTTSPSRVV